MAETGQLPEFGKIRQATSQRFQRQGQQAQEALKRRFASLGALNTGAALKQEQLAQEQIGKAQEEAMGNLDLAEAQEARRRQEFDIQAVQEPEKQRAFQREQAGLERDFRKEVFAFEKESKLKQLDLAEREYKAEQDATEFNKLMAAVNAGLDVDFEEYLKNRGFRQFVQRPRGGGAPDSGLFGLGGEKNLRGFVETPARALGKVTGIKIF